MATHATHFLFLYNKLNTQMAKQQFSHLQNAYNTTTLSYDGDFDYNTTYQLAIIGLNSLFKWIIFVWI